MKKEYAIKKLEELKNSIQTTNDTASWTTDMKSLLQDVYPKTFTDKFERIDLYFGDEARSPDTLDNPIDKEERQKDREKVKKALEDFIEDITTNGLRELQLNSEPPSEGNNTNKNSWSSNKVATYLTIFALVSGGFYWFGYTIGTFKYDKDKIDLHKIAEKKQKSIDSLQKVIKSEQESKKVIEKQLQECKKTVDNLQKLSK